MSRVITFSRTFPAHHPKAGQPTYFVEKILKGFDSKELRAEVFDVNTKIPAVSYKVYDSCTPKHHTIRAGYRWKVGDIFSPRVWSARPYNSSQVIIAPEIQIKKIFDFCIDPLDGEYRMDGCELSYQTMKEIALNDGFDDLDDFELWFNVKRSSPAFRGQIICWNNDIKY